MREAARSQRPQQQPEHGCTETALSTCFSAPFAYPCGFGVFRVTCVPAVTTSVSSVFRCRTGVTPALDGKRQIGWNPEQWGSVVGAEARSLAFYFFTFPPPGIGFWQNHFTDPRMIGPVATSPITNTSPTFPSPRNDGGNRFFNHGNQQVGRAHHINGECRKP